MWSRIHVEPGWENALEAALRERMAALEVSRLDMVQAFASDAPPAKLSFYSPPSAALPESAGALPRFRPGAAPAAAVPRRRGGPRSAHRRPTTPNRHRHRAHVQNRGSRIPTRHTNVS